MATKTPKARVRRTPLIQTPGLKPGAVNHTAQFFQNNYTGLMPYLRTVVGSKYPVLDKSGQTDDAVSYFMMKFIEKDFLKPYEESGKEIRWGHIARCCLQRTSHYVRSMGQNPISREMYGARTQMDASGKRKETLKSPPIQHKIVRSFEDEPGGPQVTDFEDVCTTNPTEVIEYSDLRNKIGDLLASAGVSRVAQSVTLLELRAQGFSHKEISEKTGRPAIKIGKEYKEIIAALSSYKPEEIRAML